LTGFTTNLEIKRTTASLWRETRSFQLPTPQRADKSILSNLCGEIKKKRRAVSYEEIEYRIYPGL